MLIELDRAIEELQKGGLVGLPTETVYGLGGVATLEAAMEQIYHVKQRPRDNPLICHFFNAEHVRAYVDDIPAYWSALVAAFSPGPVSYRLPLPASSPLKPALAGQFTVVCRIPDQPLCLEVIRQLQEPIAAPSANTSGKVSPTTALMVDNDLGSQIAGVLDGGPCTYGLESTILDCCEEDVITILRPGAVGKEELEAVLQEHGFDSLQVSYAKGAAAAVVPGSKYRHYAPDKPLLRLSTMQDVPTDEPCVLLLSDEQGAQHSWPTNASPVFLGSRHELPAVARKLYRNLKSLDERPENKAFYIQEEWGESSLGRAIANRLNRASEKVEDV
jgi:L-threonylcarbamoyladenylate synthase